MKLPVPEHLCFSVARVSRRLTCLYEARFRALGVTPIRLLVLAILQEKNGSTICELADELDYDQTTVTRLVQRMVEIKLVERMTDPGDRRVQRIFLHKEAKRHLKSWMAEAERAELETTSVLTADERATLDRLLKKLETSPIQLLPESVANLPDKQPTKKQAGKSTASK